MATQTTGGGSTTSFGNTPQGKDDSFTWTEDQLIALSLYNSTTNTITLNVMANDLGGNAKTLWSIDDGNGNALAPDSPLLIGDAANGVSAWEITASGNWTRINNGKIEYRISDGTGVAGAGVSVDTLVAGQSIDDQFVYAIRLGNGTLSQARVTVKIQGQNDAATITASGSFTGTVKEDTALQTSASGTLAVSDVDNGEAHFQAPAASALTGTYGSFTFNDGAWTYTLDNSRAASRRLRRASTTTRRSRCSRSTAPPVRRSR